MATLPEKLLSCSVESALINLKNASSYSICLIYDRFSHHEETPPHWLQKLKKTYGESVVEHTPEYASVFAGTLFEETYINSADLSFMAPAMIWALIWKHSGLLLSPDTLLLTNLKSYYNFVLLNVTANSSTTALTQFTDRHHELPGNFISPNLPWKPFFTLFFRSHYQSFHGTCPETEANCSGKRSQFY